MPSVVIGPSFFAKIRCDYQDWLWAWPREILQNSIDCDSRTIAVGLQAEDGGTLVTVANDGRPMSYEELTAKLLTLGGSGKNFEGTIGGYGVAKSLLYYMNKSYRIRSGTLLVEGSGANYEITDGLEDFHGTESQVLFAEDVSDSLARNFRRYLALCQWRGIATLNGQPNTTRLNKGRLRREFGWANVYTNNQCNDLLVVRIHGIPMFTRRIDYRGCVVVELVGTPLELLTSNRDGLQYRYQSQLDAFVTQLTVDKRSALKNTQEIVTEYRHYPGYLLAGVARKSKKPPAMVPDQPEVAAASTVWAEKSTLPPEVENMLVLPAAAANQQRPAFYSKNETGMKIPAWFLPGELMSGYSRALIGRWGALLAELATLTGRTEPFAIGFIFSEETEAEYEQRDGQRIVYVNPAVIERKAGRSRTLKNRWKFSAAGNWQLLATAIHEWTHFLGRRIHDEDFAGSQTELTGKVLANRTKFSRHFANPIAWPV